MDIKKPISYTIVILWMIAALLELKEKQNAKSILLVIAYMAFFIEAFI